MSSLNFLIEWISWIDWTGLVKVLRVERSQNICMQNSLDFYFWKRKTFTLFLPLITCVLCFVIQSQKNHNKINSIFGVNKTECMARRKMIKKKLFRSKSNLYFFFFFFSFALVELLVSVELLVHSVSGGLSSHCCIKESLHVSGTFKAWDEATLNCFWQLNQILFFLFFPPSDADVQHLFRKRKKSTSE